MYRKLINFKRSIYNKSNYINGKYVVYVVNKYRKIVLNRQ